MPDIKISLEDFTEQLKKTKNWKSTGNDQVYGYFLKRCRTILFLQKRQSPHGLHEVEQH